MAMGGEQPDREVQRATAEIADKVQRRHGLARRADRVERARDRDIIDVVPGPVGERTRLAPTGHSPVDKSRVARVRYLGAENGPLPEPGATTLQDGKRERRGKGG